MKPVYKIDGNNDLRNTLFGSRYFPHRDGFFYVSVSMFLKISLTEIHQPVYISPDRHFCEGPVHALELNTDPMLWNGTGQAHPVDVLVGKQRETKTLEQDRQGDH